MKWTTEQAEVLSARGCNLLVAAAAGSGKTAVLVERIVRLVMEGDNPADLDSILVVTFTQAAALEMKERIRKAFTLLANQGDKRAHDQLSRVVDAPISTIHSYCLHVLREHFHLAGLEPGFRVGEQTECQLMLAEALERMLDDRYAEVPLDPALAELLDCYAGYRDDSRLRDHILSLWRFSRTMPWPESWLNESVTKLQIPEGTDFGQTDWGRVLLEEATWQIADLERETEQACRLAEEVGFAGYAETFVSDAKELVRIREALPQGWDASVLAVRNILFPMLRRTSADVDPDVKERLKQMRQQVKKGVSQLVERIFYGSSETLCAEIRAESGRMETLATLARTLDRVYARMKRRRNLVDFDDLEHLTLGLLSEETADGPVPTPLAISMRERWHCVMIDEYQDSNLVQEAILGAVATQTDTFGNLFMVGDVKQSIYRFRQAMPELFLEKYARYALGSVPGEEPCGETAREEDLGTRPLPGVAARKILLHRNFRSRKPVLDAVNLAFSRLMTPQLGEMAYTEAEALQPGASFPSVEGREGVPVILSLIDATGDATGNMVGMESTTTPSDDASGADKESVEAEAGTAEAEGGFFEAESGLVEEDNGLEAADLEAIVEEAVWAAHTIRRLVHGDKDSPPVEVTGSEGRLRPIRHTDCTVLLRVTSGWAQVFVEEFALQGIPLFSDTGAGYFASMEVGVVLSFLQVLDNPRQDIPLAALLRSPLYAWGETMLAVVRQTAPEDDLYDALCRHQGEFLDACERFLADLTAWRDHSRLLSVGDLLEKMYDETGYALHVAALPQGRRRLANLRLLVDRAARFETTGYRGLFQFIRYVERLRVAKGDLDGAKVIGEGEDVVRLMSIHKSKGLEFPVVLVCGAGKKFNMRDGNRRILMHHRYGLGPDGVLPDAGATWATAAKRALQAVSMREMLSEEMRILYVALTRARERLYVCGRLPAPAEKLAALSEMPDQGPLPAGMLMPLRSHALWLLAAWSPAFRQQDAAVRMEVVARQDIAFWRSEGLATSGRPSHGMVQDNGRRNSDPHGGEAEGTDCMYRPGEDFRTIPEGQISLFDEGMAVDPHPRQVRTRMEIRRRLDWQLPFPKLSTLPSKMSVTGLKRLWEEQDEASAALEEAFRIACTAPEEVEALAAVAGRTGSPDTGTGMEDEMVMLPAFRGSGAEAETPQAGLRYGTLMHLVLQHLDPVKGRRPDVEEVLAELVARGLLTDQEAAIPNRNALHAFLQSDLYDRMVRAGIIYRETPFTVRMAAADILRDVSIPATENVVMQGIVDCWFIEDGGIVLVDYKTDRGLERVPAYRRQLSWYASALEKTVGLPVRESILWFLHLGRAI